MWSLPDLKRLNSEAYRLRKKLEIAVQTGVLDGRYLRCQHDYDRQNCSGPLSHELWFDIFSTDPKGIVTQCEYHRDHCGTPEGFFSCERCQRLMVENYTWEIYSTTTEDGELVCLPCAAEQYIAGEDNWLRLTEEDIAVLTFDVVRQARHVIGVRMPVPKQIQFFDSVTLDTSTGGMVRSFSHADSTPSAGVEELQEILHRAKEAGHTVALLILDGTYQFAASIGVYVRAAAETGNGHGRKVVQ